jgi:hypothetical protein
VSGRPFTVFMAHRRQQRRPSWPAPRRIRKIDNPPVDLWYNAANFAAPLANTYGNAGRGILDGPGHVNVALPLSKRAAVAGRSNVEFRWDASNLFNHRWHCFRFRR